ncbi:NADPH-dependent ferric siderophore reductase [Murinocardiopsis flavida]|uniref:NADPH-dependent ferric siderophore reductase n=1 Tax=Murinocardiopsis flavida TaxID=645275 RepID=A0A2P8DLP3_9ACTN|nr:siderophore-interacting protein [Murinocardiopsis flavida]PSK98142.1 NADPH-dependent ferric siderophore reductase [Murinocardiopsis flavida]
MAQPRSKSRTELFPLTPRLLDVRAVRRITPRMIRVTLGGDQLAGFRTANFADHVKLWFPDEETGAHVLPELDGDGRVGNFRAPGVIFRDYTVRGYDDARQTLDIDFVDHDHGPAGRWAGRAAPGDRIGVLGPRGTVHVPTGADYYIIAADETALPAAARWLEELPRDARVFAFLEVADSGEEQPIDAPAGAAVTWLHRGTAAPGTTGILEAAVRALPLPEGDGFAWAAGEALSLKPIRRHFKDLGFAKDDGYEVDGYWRRGTVNLDHHEDDD